MFEISDNVPRLEIKALGLIGVSKGPSSAHVQDHSAYQSILNWVVPNVYTQQTAHTMNHETLHHSLPKAQMLPSFKPFIWASSGVGWYGAELAFNPMNNNHPPGLPRFAWRFSLKVSAAGPEPTYHRAQYYPQPQIRTKRVLTKGSPYWALYIDIYVDSRTWESLPSARNKFTRRASYLSSALNHSKASFSSNYSQVLLKCSAAQ